MSDRGDFEREIAEEDQVSSILRGSDRPATIPPFADVVRRAERHQSVGPGFALAVAALLVVLIVAGIGALRTPAEPGVSSGSASPPGSPAVPSATGSLSTVPTASPLSTTQAGGPLRAEFAVIYDGVRQGYDKGSAPLVRREGETNFAVGELAPSFFNQFIGAVSPDGRRAVYFAQREGQPWTLYLLDGAKPNDQRVLKPIPGEIPNGFPLWSSDGGGVAYVVLDEGANQGVKPKYSAIRTLDLVSGAVTETARASDGSSYSVVGWERASSTLAAVISPYAAPATSYLVFSPSGPKTWTLDGQYSMYAAPNGRDVAGVRCDAPMKECSLWTWTLDDFGSKVDRKLGSNLSIISWRPGTNELGLLVGNANTVPDQIELWSLGGAPRFVAQIRGAAFGRPFFRADGSALIVQTSQTGASLVDLVNIAVSTFPLHSPEAQGESNRLRASIRVGS
jgi:hypothetical protein